MGKEWSYEVGTTLYIQVDDDATRGKVYMPYTYVGRVNRMLLFEYITRLGVKIRTSFSVSEYENDVVPMLTTEEYNVFKLDEIRRKIAKAEAKEKAKELKAKEKAEREVENAHRTSQNTYGSNL